MTDRSGASRRDFLRSGVAAGATAMLLSGCDAVEVPPRNPVPTGDVGVAAGELDEVDVAELQEALGAGRQTAERITQAYLERIETVDRTGPALNSVLELNPDALAMARTLDDERRSGKVRGPMHGIPVLLKDNIDTADRMHTSAGSLALATSIAPQDAGIVRRMRDAGMVILGKVNLSEWANIRSSRSTSGWSARGGLTRNPYALDRNACGSSAGTGAAIAASLAAVGIGTETDGSIVCPAHSNGLVGIKPTVGLVSRAGIIPISHTQDTAGPMCRTVRDAAALLSVLAGPDPRDAATSSAGTHATDYVAQCVPDGLKGARIGVLRQLFNAGPAVDSVMAASLAALRAAGAELIDPVEMPSLDRIGNAEFEVMLYELKADMAAYLATLPASVPHRTLADLIRFNETNAATELKYFGQETFLLAETKGPLTTPAYLKALETCHRVTRTEGLDRVMAQHRLDAIVAPTGGPAWVTDLVNGDHFGGGSSMPSAVSGYPAITVPAGAISGLPVGITFMGLAWSEAKLVRLAYAFEQATKVRKQPQFLTTAKLD